MNYFYGGAFNPMTKAHLHIIQTLLSDMKEDDFLIIGITNHDYKTYQYSFDLRKTILQKNLDEIKTDRIKIIEQNQRTWKFLNENEEMISLRPLTLVMGEDEYEDLKKLNVWQYSNEILQTFKIKVFDRSSSNISSTKVREMLKENKSFEELKEYITEATWNILK